MSKNHIINRLTIILSVVACLMQVGCKKLVDVPNPDTQLITARVFENSTTATSAVLNIYQGMFTNMDPYYLEQATGLLGDEFTNYSAAQYNIQYYTNAMDAQSTFGPWNNAYNYIYQANAVIESLANSPNLTAAIRNQLTGEAKFIRAFWYHYLSNCYGDVALATTTTYTLNQSLARSPKADVMQQIINDLKDAQGLLNTNFVSTNDTSATSERVRPNKWAATALLARAYLYNKDYVNAEAQATAVINNSAQFQLVSDLNRVFLANSEEAIWQLGLATPGNYYNTAEGLWFALPGYAFDQAFSPQLMAAFETGDQRKDNWVAAYESPDDPGLFFYYPFKYKTFDNPDGSEYTMILRLAEQYLVRAEARVHNSDIPGAIEDLNVIRTRAGLPEYTGVDDEASVLSAILHERQVELFTEWGHRWFDMIRTNTADAIMGAPGNVTGDKGGTWTPNAKLFPVPQTERDANHNLTQNNGY